MTDAIIEFFRNVLNNDYLTVIIISMIPLIELRGAIPVAIAMQMNAFTAFACAWAGSAIIAPILLLILQPILTWMKRFRPFRALANAVESIFQGKAAIVESKANKSADAKKIERRKLLGVFTFVALPIPLTGVWTGSAVASFMGLGFWKSLLMVCLGNVVAGSIITLLSVFLEAYIDIIIYVLLAIVVFALTFYIVKLVLHIKKDKQKAEIEAAHTADKQIEEVAETVENNSEVVENDINKNNKIEENFQNIDENDTKSD